MLVTSKPDWTVFEYALDEGCRTYSLAHDEKIYLRDDRLPNELSSSREFSAEITEINRTVNFVQSVSLKTMIMDIANQHKSTVALSGQNETHSPVTPGKSSIKRSFDVAFLMMPDDRVRQKQFQAEKLAKISDYPKDLSPRQQSPDSEYFNNNESRRFPQITVRSPRVYDDPTIIRELGENVTKSAFTKVSRQESPVPPPLSPDQLSCPSMSPPISTTPPRSNGIYHNFRPEYHFNGAFQSVGQVHALAMHNQRIKQQLMYRPITPSGSPDLIPGYMPPANGFPFANNAHPFVPQQDIPSMVRGPTAAAILSTLIPPTLASTFTLTAQNVCAKCNISFRMTSDLVYHMRSHHKTEVACDPHRRKREEKLKCPVCNESFRERHHLTRHMTAHQDKASDHTDGHFHQNTGEGSSHRRSK